jgi:hypothetical protein
MFFDNEVFLFPLEDHHFFENREYLNSPFQILFRETQVENVDNVDNVENLKEIKSNNDNFMQEKNMKYSLYPLYINWKKIETKDLHNIYYNIFKLFGYFGVAIFSILNESNYDDEDFGQSAENFLYDLNIFYLRYYDKIEENKFFKKLINIYDEVISLIKNKIIIFKEITIFLIVMRLYEKYFIKNKNDKKIIEVLKYEYIIISNIKDEEYKQIYNKYYKKLNRGCYEDFLFLGIKRLFL